MTISERSKIIHSNMLKIRKLINLIDKNQPIGNIQSLDEKTLSLIKELLSNRIKQLTEDLQEV